MEEHEGGFSEADGILHELSRASARWHTLMVVEQQSVESVHCSGHLRHLQCFDQLRRIRKLLLGPQFRAHCLTARNHCQINMNIITINLELIFNQFKTIKQ